MMPNTNQPIFILKEGTERSHGRVAQSNNIAAAKAVAEAIRTTLGPKGMDKMLVDEGGDVIITNDGATILREMDIDHPAAKMIIEVAKTQEQECYDGTTTAVILAGELLKKSEELIEQNIHPTTICRAFYQASALIADKLNEYSIKGDSNLEEIAKTALTGKSAVLIKDFLSVICVQVVESLSKNNKKIDLDEINVVKAVGGDASDSFLLNGIILDKERCHNGMPQSVNGNPAILLFNSAIQVKSTEMDANIQITDPNQITAFLQQEEDYLRNMVKKMEESGANVVICQKEIDELAKHFLNKAGIFAVEKVKKSDMDTLARCLGTTVLTNLDDLEDEGVLGECDAVNEVKIGEVPMIILREPKHEAISLLLRGGTAPFIEEIERAFNDAVGVVSIAYEDKTILVGGGAIFASLSHDLHELALETESRDSMAIKAFAEALETIPRTLAENAGLDPVDVMMSLRKTHSEGNINHGIDVETGEITDMGELGVFEPKRVVAQALKSAVETATMILRIDDVISSRKAGPQ